MQWVAVAAEPVQQRLLRQYWNVYLEVGGSTGRLRGRRWAALAAETALTAGEDRAVYRPQQVAGRIGDRRLVEDHGGLALIPDIGDLRNGPSRAVWWQWGRNTHGLTGVQDPAQLDFDPGEADLWRLRHVEGGSHAAERRQYLRCAVGQVAQLAGVHRVATRAEGQVIKLHIAAGPGELDRLELRPECGVEIDWHVRIFRRYAALPGTRRSSRDRWCRPDPDRCDPSLVS